MFNGLQDVAKQKRPQYPSDTNSQQQVCEKLTSLSIETKGFIFVTGGEEE